MLLILIGPSGVGKTSVQEMLCRDYGYNRLLSYTTRPKRDCEIEGWDYYFVDKETFNRLKLIEKVEYNGNFYGTSWDELIRKTKKPCVAVLEVRGMTIFKAIVPSAITIKLEASRDVRLKRMLSAGRNFCDAMDRLKYDEGIFDVLTDYKINTDNLTVSQVVCKVHDIFVRHYLNNVS